jgi:CheY-like chemotaxis protein
MVLMDMQMPVMDGLQAAQALRAMLDLQALPILAMTANAFGEDRAACLDAIVVGRSTAKAWEREREREREREHVLVRQRTDAACGKP